MLDTHSRAIEEITTLEETVHTHQQPEIAQYYHAPVSWWSWRPGIRPRNALLIGAACSLVALLFLSLGMVLLILGILDSTSPMLSVPAIVTRHTVNSFDNTYTLTLHLQSSGFPTTTSATVSASAYHALHDGEHILAGYSPFLHTLHTLNSSNKQGQSSQQYVLPGTSNASSLPGAIAFLLLGAALLPYPAALVRWAWRDLYAERQQHKSEISGTIVALRDTSEMQMRRPGLLPRRGIRTWYGIAILPAQDTRDRESSEITTFAINRETYQTVREGIAITLSYSPHLHYVYSLRQTGETGE